jgi:hypothetical protein
MHRPAAALAVVLTISLLAGQRLPQAQAPARTIPAPIPAEALTRARAQGTVRILLRLNVPVAPEASVGAARALSQRASIAAAQSTVLSRLGRAAFVPARRFAFVPYLALEADEADLRSLAALPEVQEIRLDRLSAPTLNESLWLTEAAAAAANARTGAGMTLAFLDTGIDKSHPHLAGRVVSEACYSTTVAGVSDTLCPGGGESAVGPDAGRPCPLPGCEHGTHVAGIAAGAGGVARSASIISIQVFSSVYTDCGWEPIPCARAYDSDIIAGLERVYALRGTYDIAAVNLSLGRDLYTGACNGEPVKPMIDQLRAAGIATIVAAGNDASPVGLSVPACVTSAISVGSTTDGSSGAPPDLVSTFTNNNAFLTLLAPGEAITSTAPGGGFAILNGTSQAAPHVTGAWAILKERNRAATVSAIATALISTGKAIVDPRNGLTKPRIRIMAAWSALPPACTFTIAPPRVILPRAGGSATITVTASQPSCTWTLAKGNTWWVSSAIEGTTQRGTQTFVVHVGFNPGGRRAGVVTIAGTVVTIEQGGGVPGDVNGDARADLIWQHQTAGSLAVWFLEGRTLVNSGAFSLDVSTDPLWRVAGSGDVNGDGVTDLVWQHAATGSLAVWLLSGAQVVATLPLSIDRMADANWQIRGVGDTNGDGFADLLWQHRTQGWLAVWLMAGATVVETRYLSLDRVADTDWQIAAAGDADGDGRADIIWQHQTSGALAVWFLDGARVLWTTRLSVDRLADTAWKLRGAGDTNGDGRADLLWQHQPTGAVGVWYLEGPQVIEQWRVAADPIGDANWVIVGPG